MNTLLQCFGSTEWAQVVKALLHSLWEGALVALALAVLLRRSINPVSRYRSSLAALASILCVGIITWAVMNAAERRASPPVLNQAPVEFINSSASVPGNTIPGSAQTVAVAVPHSVPPSIRWTAWLALTWLAGTALMLGRAGVKVAGAERLRRSCQRFNDVRITTMLAEARRAVGLARQIRVGVTDKLTSPAVVGLFVPMLILPLSLMTTLTPEQIRFVLLHELAHIRRGDYLANLFQFFAESLLFFNPAVWWISHQIRREREACCDALAIELSGAPTDYARTLVHVAENVLNPAPAAASAFGDKREPSSLLERVQRLLVPGYRPSLRLTWRAMLTALLLGSILLVLSAVGTRITVAAILTPQQRIEKIEKKMAEYGATPEADYSNKQVFITGRLTTADGLPLPRNTYVIVHSHRPNSSGISAAGLKTDGTFSNTAPAGQIWVEGTAEGFAPIVVGPFDGLSTNRIDVGELTLGRGFDVSLRVTDADSGAPIPNGALRAYLWLRGTGNSLQLSRDAKTDAQGKALLPLCIDEPITVTVNAPGYEIVDRRFETLSAGQTLEMKLSPGAIVSGTVTDESSGAPIPGATVRVLYEKGAESRNYQWNDPVRLVASTDERGQFTANQLRRDTVYWLGVSAPGHESVILGGIRAGDNASVKLDPELIVRGHVIGSVEGLQKINGRASLYLNSSETFENNSIGQGEWVPLNVENGVAKFVFTNRTRGLVRMAQSELQVDGPVADWVVDLTKPKTEAKDLPKREVIFRFNSASGVSPRGTVSITVPDSLETNHLTAHIEEKQITNGEVRVQIAIGGQTSIEPKRMIGFWFDRFGNNGSLLSIPVTNGPGPMVIDIPVIPAGAIYAKPLNADGSPAGGLMFGIDELKRSPLRSASGLLGGDSDGYSDNAPRKWVSGPLPLGGTYRVHAWRGDSFCLSKPVTLTEENPDAEVELQFTPGKTLEGIVLRTDGQPLRDADIKPEFSLPIARDNNHSFGLKSVFTDSNGRFQIQDATPDIGEYSVQPDAAGFMAERVKLNINAQPQTIRLKRGKTIAGRVVESSTGYVIPGAEVRALDYDKNKLPIQTTHTDADGRFEFTTLGDVNYTLYVEDGERTWPQNRTFRADTDTNVTLAVKPYDWSKLKPKAREASMGEAPEKPATLANASVVAASNRRQTFQLASCSCGRDPPGRKSSPALFPRIEVLEQQ